VEALEEVLELLKLPHRGSATALEAEAFRRLAGFLEARGLKPSEIPFRGVRSYGPELLALSLLLGLGFLSPLFPLAGALGFYLYFTGRRPWGRLLDRHPSRNLLAWKGEGTRALVLMAHVDTAKTYFLYHPKRVKGFRRSFLLNACLALLSPLLALTPLKWPLSLYFLLQAALLLHRELSAPYVKGGNDNASGVAVATALFLETDPPPGFRLGLALTGCEEVGALGATWTTWAGGSSSTPRGRGCSATSPTGGRSSRPPARPQGRGPYATAWPTLTPSPWRKGGFPPSPSSAWKGASPRTGTGPRTPSPAWTQRP